MEELKPPLQVNANKVEMKLKQYFALSNRKIKRRQITSVAKDNPPIISMVNSQHP